MKDKYAEIMDRIHVTESMRSEVLHSVLAESENADVKKAAPIQPRRHAWKRALAAAGCAAAAAAICFLMLPEMLRTPEGGAGSSENASAKYVSSADTGSTHWVPPTATIKPAVPRDRPNDAGTQYSEEPQIVSGELTGTEAAVRPKQSDARVTKSSAAPVLSAPDPSSAGEPAEGFSGAGGGQTEEMPPVSATFEGGAGENPPAPAPDPGEGAVTAAGGYEGAGEETGGLEGIDGHTVTAGGSGNESGAPEGPSDPYLESSGGIPVNPSQTVVPASTQSAVHTQPAAEGAEGAAPESAPTESEPPAPEPSPSFIPTPEPSAENNEDEEDKDAQSASDSPEAGREGE